MNTSTHVSQFSTLADVLQYRAARQPDDRAFTFLEHGTTEKTSLTYKELDQRAQLIASALQATSTVGDRTLLLYPPGLDFIIALFGCIYAGNVAVTAYPPTKNQKISRLHGIINNSQPTMLLSTSSVITSLRSQPTDETNINAIQWLATDEVPDDATSSWCKPALDPHSIALLQYTSGSTSTPKGVMVSHLNLLHNSAYIKRAFELTRDSVSVTWLPSFHDMGLIDGIIQPVYTGFPGYLMSPASFLQQPMRWLQAISRYRATHSGGPNFAYALCASKTTPQQREGLDLGCWTTAYNGAEPIRAPTLRLFSKTFEPYGFRSHFFYPCYGLAEATLMVTGGRVDEEPIVRDRQPTQVDTGTPFAGRTSSQLVGCGRAHLDTRVVIVDPKSLKPCPPDQVGEVWVAGKTVAAGYWQDADKTRKIFRAKLEGDSLTDFLRTGDLGFLRNNELFVTGRLKDLLIIRGRNHYPQDIEFTVEQSHQALRPGCGAALGVESEDTEQLIIVHEIKREYLANPDIEEIAATVRRAVAEKHEVQIHSVVLLRPGRIPKTSSGKIQRYVCREVFLAGSFDEVGRSILQPVEEVLPDELPNRQALLRLPSTERRQRLAEYFRCAVSQVLRCPPQRMDLQRPLLQSGLDSLGAVTLMHRLETDLGLSIPMVDFLQDVSAQDAADHVAELLEGSSSEISAPLNLPRKDILAPPLSQGQKALWFLHQMAPQSTAYNVFCAVRILSDLDVNSLEGAFTLVTERHSALRTSIATVDGRPVQRIRQETGMDFEVVEASRWAPDALHDYLLESSHRPFDLQEGPLLRIRLCVRNSNEYVLLLVAHHIVMDFWSLVVIMDELRLAYSTLKARKPLRLPPCSRQSVDHGFWQLDLLESPVADCQWKYWKTQLEGAVSTLTLPSDRRRTATNYARGATERFQMDPDRTRKLRELAKSEGVTLYMLLLAAFQVQLYRYSGQQDICVGTSANSRNRAEFSDVVGYLVNQLVMRSKLSGNARFKDFLYQVKQTVLNALKHQDFPFPLLVERLRPERDTSHSPLFQVMFVLEKTNRLQPLASLLSGTPGASMYLGDLKLEAIPLEHLAAQYDVTLSIMDDGESLSACWQYNRDMFERTTIKRMNGHLQTLLAGIVDNPDQLIATLPILSTGERRQLLVEWNRTQTPYAGEQYTHRLFEAQAARTPDAVAVTDTERALTYRELNTSSNQVANHLAHLGIGADSIVGIYMPRCVETVIAILGVLKAGGAYLPLDPSQPERRLSDMLEDAKLEVLLTKQHLLSKIPAFDMRAICLDTDWPMIATNKMSNPESTVRPDNLAYVIYTSGSSGRPKGVMITHRGMVNYLSWCTDAYMVADGDGAPVNSSMSFDATLTSLFSPLLSGRKVSLLPEQREIEALGEALRHGSDFSLVKITPAHLELLRCTLPPDQIGLGTRSLIIGGEALSPATVKFWRACAPETRIVNEYGPTETVVGCCVYEVNEDAFPSGIVPIGRPIANTEIYLLDSRLQPVPVGVAGELYIGGAGVARGYLNRPDLTSERFIPNPFRSDTEARIYRTGDLARYQSDGTLEFLGRSDNQTKIRGFRVEPGEVEAALLQHGDIREAMVDVYQDDAGNPLLAAYVVQRQATTRLTTAELRRFLETRLPSYMIPSSLVRLEALPLTPNGKLDKRSLPKPENVRPQPAGTCIQPRSKNQRLIAGVWRKLLHLDEVGIHDNFFDLGGHSLLATQVHQRLQERLDRQIPITDLFEFPTIDSLARHLDQGNGIQHEFQEIHDRASRQRRAIVARRKLKH